MRVERYDSFNEKKDSWQPRQPRQGVPEDVSRSVARDWTWSDRFVPHVQVILASLLSPAAPLSQDREEATDFLVFQTSSARVACRVRRWPGEKWFEVNRNEITIRAVRGNGVETELDKILSGFGDFLFYAIANQTENDFASWTLCNLSVFRDLVHHTERIPGHLKWNRDGSSAFLIIPLAEMPSSFVVARGTSLREFLTKRFPRLFS